MKLQKIPTAAIIALVVAAIALTATTAAVLSSSQNVPLNGSITAINLGVYSDSACTQTVTSLNVGTIIQGGTGTQTVYIKNTGNAPETLTMTANNWNPSSASTYLTLTWNQQNTVLSAGQSIQATLTLTAASNTGSLTNFSCNVTLTGTQ
jgi:hypothetical protein